MQIENHPESVCHCRSPITTGVLAAGSPIRYTTGIATPQNSIGEVQFGSGSDFGFHKPFCVFDLPAARSESPTIRFGIGSVGVGVRYAIRKAVTILQLSAAITKR